MIGGVGVIGRDGGDREGWMGIGRGRRLEEWWISVMMGRCDGSWLGAFSVLIG